MSPRLIVSSCIVVTSLAGCAEPCTDDGLLQDDRDGDCPNLASDGSTSDGPSVVTATTDDGSTLWCADRDGDGHGDPNSCQPVPPGGLPPLGTVSNADDCADNNPHTFVGAATENPGVCLQDADGDGFGDANPPEGIVPGSDCDDTDPLTNPAIAVGETTLGCFRDADGDGFGDNDPPEGVAPGSDCDDANEDAYPGAAANDGTACTIDRDGDGFGDADPPDGIDPGSDCDDDDPQIHPGAAPEDGLTVCTIDADGDGFGDANPPDGIDAGTDCDDDNPQAFPGAAPLDDPDACMEDADGDGYGDNVPPGGVTPGSDCDDDDTSVPEVNPCTLWCIDADGDGFGDPTLCMNTDAGVEGYVSNNADCVDDNDAIFPGAALEEGGLCTIDADGDGYGDAAASDIDSSAQNGTDCADDNLLVHPGAEHEPDLCTIDADGDGFGDANASSIDPDAQDGTDCVDDNDAIYPGAAAEEPELCTIDADGDGFGSSRASEIDPAADNGTDCNDSASEIIECFTLDAGSCVEATPVQGVTLGASVSGGSGTYTYAWAPEGSLSSSVVATPVATPDNYESYTVTVSDGLSSLVDAVTVVSAEPFDLEDRCDLIAFDLATSEAPPTITYASAGTVACQPTSGDVGLHLCDVDFENTRLEGTLIVEDVDGDDDNIGFVWGASDSSHFYHFTWKRLDQPQADNVAVCPDGGTNLWPGGMLIKRVDADSAEDVTLRDLFCDYDTDNSVRLLGPGDVTTDGWEFGVTYAIVLDFTSSGTDVTITNTGSGIDVASFSVDTRATPRGRFGTLTYSQPGVCTGPWNASCIAP